MIKVGFTGTRNGLTIPQWDALNDWAAELILKAELHHGRCVGADREMHGIALHYGWRIVLHPGINPPHLVAECPGADAVYATKPNLERNVDIVMSTSQLIAAPDGPERQRSGTWSTVRKARSMQRPILIFMPDGSVIEEPGYTHGSDDTQ